MGFDTAYEAITEHNDETRWAFGTGFEDPFAGVDTSLPDGVDRVQLANYCLALADEALVLSHRLQEWLTRAPELEEETALANIGLDLLGQARLLYSRAGAAENAGRTEDDFAFFRTEREFRNVRLVEPVDPDFGSLVVRLFLFSVWRRALLDRLRTSADPVLAAIAAKGVKEVTYHRDYAAEWVIRLAGGTDYSRRRILNGLARVVPLLPELFRLTEVERPLVLTGIAVDPGVIEEEVITARDYLLRISELPWPETPALARVSGREGREGAHTEAMGFLLAELQSVARAHPGAIW